jgi:hypothetical protein
MGDRANIQIQHFGVVKARNRINFYTHWNGNDESPEFSVTIRQWVDAQPQTWEDVKALGLNTVAARRVSA